MATATALTQFESCDLEHLHPGSSKALVRERVPLVGHHDARSQCHHVVAVIPLFARGLELVPARRDDLEGIEVEGAAKDIPVATLLAIETVALRWQAYGAKSSDHGLLLETLRLSSALAATK